MYVDVLNCLISVCTCVSIRVRLHELPACIASTLQRCHAVAMKRPGHDPAEAMNIAFLEVGFNGEWASPPTGRKAISRAPFECNALWWDEWGLVSALVWVSAVATRCNETLYFIPSPIKYLDSTKSCMSVLVMFMLLATVVWFFFSEITNTHTVLLPEIFDTVARFSWALKLIMFAHVAHIWIICWKLDDRLTTAARTIRRPCWVENDATSGARYLFARKISSGGFGVLFMFCLRYQTDRQPKFILPCPHTTWLCALHVLQLIFQTRESCALHINQYTAT